MDRVAPDVPARAIHSVWFEFLGEHGFPAFAIWLGMIVASVVYTYRLARLARGKPELAWAYDLARMTQVAVVAYAVGGSFLSLSYWDVFWTVLLVAPAAYAVARREAARQPASAQRGEDVVSWRARARSSLGGPRAAT
jgi:O-antigen ligase